MSPPLSKKKNNHQTTTTIKNQKPFWPISTIFQLILQINVRVVKTLNSNISYGSELSVRMTKLDILTFNKYYVRHLCTYNTEILIKRDKYHRIVGCVFPFCLNHVL